MKQLVFLSGIFLIFLSSNAMAQTNGCGTDAKGILSGENGELFRTEHDAYKANTDALSKTDFSGVSLKVVLGNWCEDSQREVPRLMKILETPALKNVATAYYLVDREKYCADPEVQKLEVKFVPAIIVYRNGKELGRIIETPQGSLEENLAAILK